MPRKSAPRPFKLADGYDREQYEKDTKFLAAAGPLSTSPTAQIDAKRAAIKIIYPKLTGRGGEPVLVDDCNPERIGSAFPEMYEYVKKRAGAYERTIDYLFDLERTQPLGPTRSRIGERIAVQLDSCTPEQLTRLARKYGEAALGDYKRFMQPELFPA